MGKEITYRCDKCGTFINKQNADTNGVTENFYISISNRPNGERIYFCHACWESFEKLFCKFIKKELKK